MTDNKKDSGSVELISLESLLAGDDRNPIGIISDKSLDTVDPPLNEEGDDEGEKKDDVIIIDPADDISSLKDKKDIDEVINEGGREKSSEKQETAPKEMSEQLRQTLKSAFGITTVTEEDEDGNEVEVSIDDIDVDNETFQKLVEQELAFRKEEASKGKISADGLSDHTKKLIEIEHNGGDTLKLLQIKEAYSDPLSQLDLTTKQGQIDAIYLRQKSKGATDKEVSILLKGLEAEGILEEEAFNAEAELKAIIDKTFEDERIKSEKLAAEREEQAKKFKKDFREKLSEKFTLNDTLKNKLVTALTKKGEDGKYQLDQAYLRAMSNPDVATELVLFLTDREEFIKQVSTKEVQKAKMETARKLKIVRGSNGGSGTSDPTKQDKLIPLDNL